MFQRIPFKNKSAAKHLSLLYSVNEEDLTEFSSSTLQNKFSYFQ